MDIAHAMATKQTIVIDFMHEGPDLTTLGFYRLLLKLCDKFSYPQSNITIYTANALEKHGAMNIVYQPPMHLITQTKSYAAEVPKTNALKHFGMFIGRSNAERLYLASYIDSNYRDLALISYHFNIDDEFHTNNIGIDELIRTHGIKDVRTEAQFLSQCPRKLDNNKQVTIDKSSDLNPAQQILNNDRATFMQNYRNFFVEIVCESYFTGNTFFPTEKIFRPMLLKTPFIVQGAQFFLHKLRDLGFKTFDKYWDEGYAEDPSDWQLQEIIKVIDYLSQKSISELNVMYQDMQPIIEHNYQRLMSLTGDDLIVLAEKN